MSRKISSYQPLFCFINLAYLHCKQINHIGSDAVRWMCNTCQSTKSTKTRAYLWIKLFVVRYKKNWWCYHQCNEIFHKIIFEHEQRINERVWINIYSISEYLFEWNNWLCHNIVVLNFSIQFEMHCTDYIYNPIKTFSNTVIAFAILSIKNHFE